MTIFSGWFKVDDPEEEIPKVEPNQTEYIYSASSYQQHFINIYADVKRENSYSHRTQNPLHKYCDKFIHSFFFFFSILPSTKSSIYSPFIYRIMMFIIVYFYFSFSWKMPKAFYVYDYSPPWEFSCLLFLWIHSFSSVNDWMPDGLSFAAVVNDWRKLFLILL